MLHTSDSSIHVYVIQTYLCFTSFHTPDYQFSIFSTSQGLVMIKYYSAVWVSIQSNNWRVNNSQFVQQIKDNKVGIIIKRVCKTNSNESVIG